MARVDSRLALIFDAVRDRVVDQVLGANTSNVIISSDPDSTPPMPTDIWYVVSPAPSGQFTDNFAGGGTASAEVQTAFVVTIHTTIQEDEIGRSENFFLNKEYGVLPKMHSVLAALSAHDLKDGDGTNEVLSQPIFPADYQWHQNSRTHGSLQIGFTVVFDWDF